MKKFVDDYIYIVETRDGVFECETYADALNIILEEKWNGRKWKLTERRK